MTCGARTRRACPRTSRNGQRRGPPQRPQQPIIIPPFLIFFNSESRHAAANARTISDPLVSDLVRETVPARLLRRSPIRKR